MARSTLVGSVMTTDVITFSPDDNVQDAMAVMVQREVDAAPVVDRSGEVVGMLSTGDLIVQETTLHWPTVITLLGATLELPSSKRHFDEDIRRALGSSVEEVMSADPVTIGEDDTLEQAATLMHERKVSRLPVVRNRALIGIISRTDIVRALVAEPTSAEAASAAGTDEAGA